MAPPKTIAKGIIQISAKEGMHTMDDSLIHLARSQAISPEEAMANSRDPKYVGRELERSV